MATKAAYKRVGIIPRLSSIQYTHFAQLSKEYVAMQKEPPPFVWASPDEKDILICALSPLSRHHLKLISLLSGNFIIVRVFCRPLMPRG